MKAPLTATTATTLLCSLLLNPLISDLCFSTNSTVHAAVKQPPAVCRRPWRRSFIAWFECSALPPLSLLRTWIIQERMIHRLSFRKTPPHTHTRERRERRQLLALINQTLKPVESFVSDASVISGGQETSRTGERENVLFQSRDEF